MATEVLSVPEERLPEVIKIIRDGLMAQDIGWKLEHADTCENLNKWCDEEEAYIQELARDDDDAD